VVRILLLLELPVLAYVALYVFPHWHEPDPRGGLQAMAHLWWLIAALSVVLVAVHTIAAERSRLNLETLLTTPLSGRRILQEKARGLAPLLGALAVPYLTLVVVSALHSTENPPTYGDDLEALFGAWHGLGYAVLALLTAAVYLPLLGWLGLLIGSKVRSLTRGVLVAIFGVAGWCALPILGLVLLEAAGIVDIFREGIKAQALVLSPASMVLSMEMGRFPTPEGAPSWAFIILNTAWHLGLLFAVRWWSLRWADVRLGRAVTAGAERVPAEAGKAQT
jgi:ABC-type Na+ efflux pump permease subunit